MLMSPTVPYDVSLPFQIGKSITPATKYHKTFLYQRLRWLLGRYEDGLNIRRVNRNTQVLSIVLSGVTTVARAGAA